MLEDAHLLFDSGGYKTVDNIKDFLRWAIDGTEFAIFKEVLGPRQNRLY